MTANGGYFDVWGALDEVLTRFDGDFRVEMGSGLPWAGQLRVTLTNPSDGPSRSMTFYSVGAWCPEDVASAVLADLEAWMMESGVEPLPVAAWKR